MSDQLMNLFDHILKYNDKTIYIAFDSKLKPYFHANQLCQILEYNDCKRAIRINVDKEDIFPLSKIVKNYKMLYKNVQGTTKFLSEIGMYSLILASRTKRAKEIKNWITREVMPSLRKYGEYKLNHKYETQIAKLNRIIYEQRNQINILEHNLKKAKYDKGGMIYILRVINDKRNLNLNETLYLKFDRTINMNKRKPLYDTCTHNKVQVLKTIQVNNPKIIEQCVIELMNKYQIQNRKEYFKCSYNQLISAISQCINYYEDKLIDKKPDVEFHDQKVNGSNRQRKINNLIYDEIKILKILNDKEFDELCELKDNNNEIYDSDYNSNSDSDLNSKNYIEDKDGNENYDSDSDFNSNPDFKSKNYIEDKDRDENYDSDYDFYSDYHSDNENHDFRKNYKNNTDVCDNIQVGGNNNVKTYLSYLKYKLKYLQLKYDLT